MSPFTEYFTAAYKNPDAAFPRMMDAQIGFSLGIAVIKLIDQILPVYFSVTNERLLIICIKIMFVAFRIWNTIYVFIRPQIIHSPRLLWIITNQILLGMVDWII